MSILPSPWMCNTWNMLKLYDPSPGEQTYFRLKPELEKKFKPDDYVVINPKTSDYVVAKTSVEAMKLARNKYPRGHLFLAQVGRMAGFLK